MPRPNLRRRVRKLWKRSPGLGDKVTIWIPKELRGRKGVVVATAATSTSNRIRKAPEDKLRIRWRDKNCNQYVICSLEECLPGELDASAVLG